MTFRRLRFWSLVAPFLVTVVTSCGGPKAENTEMIKLILDLSSNPKTIRPTETSNESGRQFFDYGDTKLGGQTKMVWYNSSNGWVEVKEPKLSADDIAASKSIVSDNGVVKIYEVTGRDLNTNYILQNKLEFSIFFKGVLSVVPLTQFAFYCKKLDYTSIFLTKYRPTRCPRARKTPSYTVFLLLASNRAAQSLDLGKQAREVNLESRQHTHRGFRVALEGLFRAGTPIPGVNAFGNQVNSPVRDHTGTAIQAVFRIEIVLAVAQENFDSPIGWPSHFFVGDVMQSVVGNVHQIGLHPVQAERHVERRGEDQPRRFQHGLQVRFDHPTKNHGRSLMVRIGHWRHEQFTSDDLAANVVLGECFEVSSGVARLDGHELNLAPWHTVVSR